MSVQHFSNSGGDNGASYIDFIAHRHHMRWRKMAEDVRNSDVKDRGIGGGGSLLSFITQ